MVISGQSVFLFIGNDSYLKEEALKDLTSSLSKISPGQYGQLTFYADTLDSEEVLGHLNTIPLLSDKLLIVIKEIEKASDDFRDNLIKYIKAPAKSICLALEARSDSVLKDYSEVTKQISVRSLTLPRGDLLISWIRDYARSEGKTIDRGAIAVLMELEGSDLSYLSRELDKLVTFVGDRSEISSGDVESLIGGSLVKSAFDIADAVGRKDAALAMKICSDLSALGRKEYEVIGILSWHLKRMLRAGILRARGENNYAIASLIGIGRRFQDEFFRQLSIVNIAKVKSDIELLLRSDLDIKRSKFDPGTILEFTLIGLCLH